MIAPHETWRDEKTYSRNDLDSYVKLVLESHGLKLGTHVDQILASRAEVIYPPECTQADPLAGLRDYWNVVEPEGWHGPASRTNDPRFNNAPQFDDDPWLDDDSPADGERSSAETFDWHMPEPNGQGTAGVNKASGKPHQEPPAEPKLQMRPEVVDEMDAKNNEFIDAHAIPTFKQEAMKMKLQGMSVPEIAAKVGKHRGTVYRWLNDAAEAQGTCLRQQHPFHLMSDSYIALEDLENKNRAQATRARNHKDRQKYLSEARRCRSQLIVLMDKTGMYNFSQIELYNGVHRDREMLTRAYRPEIKTWSATGEIPGRAARDAELCVEAKAQIAEYERKYAAAKG